MKGPKKECNVALDHFQKSFEKAFALKSDTGWLKVIMLPRSSWLKTSSNGLLKASSTLPESCLSTSARAARRASATLPPKASTAGCKALDRLPHSPQLCFSDVPSPCSS